MVTPIKKEQTLDIFKNDETPHIAKEKTGSTKANDPIWNQFDPLSSSSGSAKNDSDSAPKSKTGELDLLSQIQGWGAENKHADETTEPAAEKREETASRFAHNPKTGLNDSRTDDDGLPSPQELAKLNE